MDNKWQVTSNIIADKPMYAVYRLKDVNGIDHSGNREFAGGYTEYEDAAQLVADELNKAERQKESPHQAD